MKKLQLITAFLTLFIINISFAQDNLNPKISQENNNHDADLPNNGPSGPIHKKYMGKIVFSLKESALEFGAENEAEFSNRFTLGQPFFFRVYMSNSLSNFVSRLYGKNTRSSTDDWAALDFKFYVDNVATAYIHLVKGTFDKEMKQTWTTWKGRCNTGEESRLGVMTFKEFFAKAQDKLTIGDHKIRIEIYPSCMALEPKIGPMITEGEFTLTVPNNAFNPNDPTMCLPKAKMQDKAIETGMLKAFNSSNSRGEGKVARIAESNWRIIRNETTGIILRRSIDGIIGSTKNGKCKYQIFGFSQDYDGSKYQNEIYLENEGSSNDVNCGCIR